MGSLSNLRGDIYGGLTAAVVALPLALAFGVASGVGPIAGLYGAIAVGFFAAVFGGTPAQVSGPTGPMTVVMAAVVAQHADNLPEAFAIVILGGALQVALGVLKVGRYVSYTPYSVVSGFMSGIGVIIILIQTLPFIGVPAAGGGPLGAIRAWPTAILQIDPGALAIAALALTISIFWPARLRALLPAPLAALIFGTLAALFVFPDAPAIGNVPTGLPDLTIPLISLDALPSILQPALILALLGSIDSLLTSLVADSVTRTRHKSNKELIGQGIGNMVAGLIGGLPGAGATMRTVVNVRAGGRTPVSGALHAIVLLALVLGLGPIAEVIPHAALAGILMKVGWDIIDWGYLKRIRRAPREKVFVMFVTLGLTVFVDLIIAVGVGLILAGFATARWMEVEELKGLTAIALPDNDSPLTAEECAALEKFGGKVTLILLRGRFSYASARELVQRAGPGGAGEGIVVFDFSEAAHMDTSAALAVEELINIAQEDDQVCIVCGLSSGAANTLRDLGVFKGFREGNVVTDRTEALALSADILAKK
jgi:SulP family sulfate permease